MTTDVVVTPHRRFLGLSLYERSMVVLKGKLASLEDALPWPKYGHDRGLGLQSDGAIYNTSLAGPSFDTSATATGGTGVRHHVEFAMLVESQWSITDQHQRNH